MAHSPGITVNAVAVELTFSGTIVKRYEDDGERKLDLELSCTKADGSIAVQGWATFVVP